MFIRVLLLSALLAVALGAGSSQGFWGSGSHAQPAGTPPGPPPGMPGGAQLISQDEALVPIVEADPAFQAMTHGANFTVIPYYSFGYGYGPNGTDPYASIRFYENGNPNGDVIQAYVFLNNMTIQLQYQKALDFYFPPVMWHASNETTTTPIAALVLQAGFG